MVRVFQVLGGLALFLFGVRVLSGGLEKIAGHRLQEWLDRMTSQPIRGALFGAAATALIQSSSLLMVTMIGLINAKLLTLEQAVGVMMGGGVGTTLTAQIIAFNVGDLSYLFIVLGLVLVEFVPNRAYRSYGEVVLGFGVLFLGMQTMSGALKVMAGTPNAQAWLARMGQGYLLGILAGAIATAVVQSSSAVTGLLVAMGISQVITLSGAIAVLLGANIGTCVTGLIASLRLSRASRRASLAQVLINVIGVLLFLPLVSPFTALVTRTSASLARQIANAHTIFNVAVSVVLFPFAGTIARLSERLIPAAEDEQAASLSKYIDESQYRFPHIALAEATQELHRIGEVTADMIVLSRQAVVQGDTDAAQKVLELEDELIDPLCATLDTHLSELLQEDVSEEQRWYAFRLKRRISDVERVADLAMDLARAALEKVPPKKVLGKKALRELDQLFKRTHRTYLLALQAVQDSDRDIAQMALRQDEKMRRVYWKSRRRLARRVEAGRVEEAEDALFAELLRSLERISDHADNLGVSVMRA